MDAGEIGRRIVIARVWAGYVTREEFVEVVKPHGITGRVLGRLENGEREPNQMEREKIAELTGVPVAFLTDGEFDPFKRNDGLAELRAEVRGLLGVLLGNQGTPDWEAVAARNQAIVQRFLDSQQDPASSERKAGHG